MPACAAAPRTSRITTTQSPPALFVGGANGQAQARTLTPHNQTRAVSYTVETLSDKSRHIPLKRRAIHGRDRDVPTRIDCQCRGPGSS
jgi:hypothetical protein